MAGVIEEEKTEINSKFEHSRNVFGNKSKGKREKKHPK